MKARAPERMAPTTEFSSSYIERMTILQSGWMAQDFGRGLDAVQSGQADVHQHHVRAQALDELHGVGAVLGFADDAKFVARG